ncbi:family 78 glycoside hydrolase catalytic domain [Hymenobacter sp. GOD-10R]|uniref:family 78 glycoside hydrolase catalytic domain n=1 Tax=Hymenobacter sp. GOD-10R TaxID=3093922 RepID=UPI002D76DD41|nr:family 78 glycoside hydrolase catalytic domain [Hymenobacter sp. GOD-10R]WRQ29188.1 family 78 glycoside hydrolase catalytic domain [Hymenobacter sp. GOD-10R]
MLSTYLASAQQLVLKKLTCEYKADPKGIEVTVPRLGWQLNTDRRGAKQLAYRILVADTPELLKANTGNVWDSKKVNSGASIQVAYAGKPLQPTKNYYWKVMAWDNQNTASAWSSSAKWQMGLPAKADWKGARWIAYEQLPDSSKNVLPTDGKKDRYYGSNTLPLLRKSFTLKKNIKKATIFVSGLGHFELSLNGQKVGEHFLDAGWTKYDQEAQYVTFDLTERLKAGPNSLGVMLGNGFYYVPPVKGRYRKLKVAFGYPKMICRLLVEYADGTTQNILSDQSWRTAPSPITFSSIYGGEDYNATLEQPGWDTPSFQEPKGNWKPVLLVDGPPRLTSQLQEPLKVFENFAPKKTTQPVAGTWVYDLGQNASGIVQLQVKGHKGDTVRIWPAELLKEDGTINQKNAGSPYYFQYILKGEGTETWQPRFSYYGFRYLQVKGGVPQGEANPQNAPQLVALKGLHIRNAAERAGEFACSNELFNHTHTLIDWAIKSNMVSTFTDCPHREKLGWLEQTHLMLSSVLYNYDVPDLTRKVLQDIRSSQLSNGLVPEIAPEYVKFEWGGDMFRDSPEWGSTSIITPWYLYQWYGDRQTLAASYPTMQRYIAYLGTKANGHILSQGLGDWYDLGPKPPGVSQLTPMGVTGTAMYYYDLTLLSKIARLLGKPQDAASYDQLAAEVKTAFNAKFFNKDTKQYATGSQAANAMAVYMKLVEPQDKAAVIENIVKDIRSRNNSLTAGDIGYRYLLQVLDEEGRSDVIFDMNSRSDVPGYGYQLAKGATALTESWAALPTVSNNHFMLGHLMEWLYGGLAGIRPAKDGVAFNKIDIRPEPVGDVTAAKASYHSPYGLIISNWKKIGNTFELTATIPANTTATIYLPAMASSKIVEGTQPLAQHQDLKLLGIERGKARISASAGTYHFVVSTN